MKRKYEVKNGRIKPSEDAKRIQGVAETIVKAGEDVVDMAKSGVKAVEEFGRKRRMERQKQQMPHLYKDPPGISSPPQGKRFRIDRTKPFGQRIVTEDDPEYIEQGKAIKKARSTSPALSPAAAAPKPVKGGSAPADKTDTPLTWQGRKIVKK